MYRTTDPKVNFPQLEENILQFWTKNRVFQRSIEQREGSEEFVFYDGPPFATGLPHFGHFVPNTIKDIIPRYQTMKGKKVERRFGWDCHGLPVENLVEQELGLNSRADIENYGVAQFNQACHQAVLRYVEEWKRIISRLGRWVDFDHDYKTMEHTYMESIWWVMKQLWQKGLLYEGYNILPYCPRCSTVLSNHELNMGGYKDVHDPAVTIKFRLKKEKNTFFLAWTTTPWTLPSNLALCLGAELDYVKIKNHDEYFILAKNCLAKYYPNSDKIEIVWQKKGIDLVGLKYEPLFPYFAWQENAFLTLVGAHVTDTNGTGIVHTAPGFGEDDYHVLKGTGIPTVCPIDEECRFTAEIKDYQGLFVKDADKSIIQHLKTQGHLFERDQILHAYPHCWRCSSPLIYRAISSWFVRVEKIKNQMLTANEKIRWVPDHIQSGRFGQWLKNARDWAISRNRFWGNPLPIWRCESCHFVICVGSLDELERLSGHRPSDLHKPFVDEIVWPCSCGQGTCQRVKEVLDCWFESGAMPYAQNHYPFENKDRFENHFPANFINEGLDQTRGWFYTLTVLATGLFEKPAFQNCIVSGLVLASDGRKMSKSLRNYTDPYEVMTIFGADALRLFLMMSPATKADDLRYNDDGVRNVLRETLLPLWSAYSFFVTHANADNIQPTGRITHPANPLDAWILSETQRLIQTVTDELDHYQISHAIEAIINFLNLLNNWYIRRSRRRFVTKNDHHKLEAYDVFYQALKQLTTVAAPFIPFITEEIWQNLRLASDPDSVHLADWPKADPKRENKELEHKMILVRRAVSMGRALRSTHNLRNRQPLKAVYLVTRRADEKAILCEMEELIREELNVKEVIFQDNEENLVEYSAKANFKILGKTLGQTMKSAATCIEALSKEEILSLLEGATLHIEVDGKAIQLDTHSVLIHRQEKSNLKVLNEESLTVALDSEISFELKLEGHARDIIRTVQNLRRAINLNMHDKIVMHIGGSQIIKSTLASWGDHIQQETLANSWLWEKHESAASEKHASLVGTSGDEKFFLAIEKL